MTATVASLPVHPAADLFPMLSGDDLKQLADDIAEHGLREPVWTWVNEDGTECLLDGRNRIAACAESGTVAPTRRYEGDDPINFVVSLNISRRHLTAGQRAMLALELVPLYEEEARKAKAKATSDENRRRAAERLAAERADYAAPLVEVEPIPVCAGLRKPEPKVPHRSTAKAAATTKASSRAVDQAKRVTDKAPDLAKKVKTGEIAIDRAERIIRDREAEQRRVDQAKVEAAQMGDVAVVDIRHGDFRDVLSDLADVDAIITDPPYPHEFIPLLGDLATWADKVLAENGILAVLMGQTYLPEVYRLLDTGRPYRWTACYLTPGNGYASMKARVQSNWKPLIVYGGGPRFADIIRSEGTDAAAKDNHKWGQDYGAFHTIIERLTERGQTVVDPFMGSGTTLLAAHALGRHAIGCDVDKEHVAKAQERLS
jgi:16S rRNA G966 N2-methylase RsmD